MRKIQAWFLQCSNRCGFLVSIPKMTETAAIPCGSKTFRLLVRANQAQALFSGYARWPVDFPLWKLSSIYFPLKNITAEGGPAPIHLSRNAFPVFLVLKILSRRETRAAQNERPVMQQDTRATSSQRGSAFFALVELPSRYWVARFCPRFSARCGKCEF